MPSRARMCRCPYFVKVFIIDTLTSHGQPATFISERPGQLQGIAVHPMRIVIRRTGLTPDVLRAWEKRYGVVSPIRSEGGQRLYSDADIEYLSLLTRAVRAGRAIGQVAKLPMDELQAIVQQDESADLATPTRAPASPESLESLQATALFAVQNFDSAGFEAILRGGVLRLGIDVSIDGLIAPLLATLGVLWHQRTVRPVHEHLASAVIRRTLMWMMESSAATIASPALVVTTLPGQTHELGALLAAASASSHGWRVVYLGPSLPATDIAAAASETSAAAVALSFVYPLDDPTIPDALSDLRRALTTNTPILVGGRAVAAYAEALAAVKAVVFATIAELSTWLREAGIAR